MEKTPNSAALVVKIINILKNAVISVHRQGALVVAHHGNNNPRDGFYLRCYISIHAIEAFLIPQIYGLLSGGAHKPAQIVTPVLLRPLWVKVLLN